MAEWAEQLKARGVLVYAPRQKHPQNWGTLSDVARRELQKRFIDEHNQAIDEYDVLFIFNPDKCNGASVTLEIGYALAKGKPIYAMRPDEDLGRDVLFVDYCETTEDLIKVLHKV